MKNFSSIFLNLREGQEIQLTENMFFRKPHEYFKAGDNPGEYYTIPGGEKVEIK